MKKKERRRLPRSFGVDNRIVPYDEHNAEGLNILNTIEGGKYNTFKYLAHYVTNKNKTRCLLVTETIIFYLMDMDLLVSYKWKVKWRAYFTRMDKIVKKENSNTVELCVYDINWKPSTKEIKTSSHEMMESIFDIIAPRARKDINAVDTIVIDDIDINTAPIKTGLLTKCGTGFHSWKERWFILEEGNAKYYREEGGDHLGTIAIKGNRVILSDANKKKHVFSVITPKQTYHIQAKNEHERQSWISAMVQHGALYE